MKANKDFDLLLLPRTNHGFGNGPGWSAARRFRSN
jgi:hypothetical protein